MRIVKLVLFILLFIACLVVAIHSFCKTGVVEFMNSVALIADAIVIGATVEEIKGSAKK